MSIRRLTAQSNSLTLRDAQDETQVVRISSLDSSWSLFRPEKMPVADGERLRVTGKIPGLRVSGGDRLQVASVSEDAMTVVVPGRAEPAWGPRTVRSVRCAAPAWMHRRWRPFCMTRSCCSAAEKRRISATRCSCSMRALWWAIPTWHGHTP